MDSVCVFACVRTCDRERKARVEERNRKIHAIYSCIFTESYSVFYKLHTFALCKHSLILNHCQTILYQQLDSMNQQTCAHSHSPILSILHYPIPPLFHSPGPSSYHSFTLSLLHFRIPLFSYFLNPSFSHYSIFSFVHPPNPSFIHSSIFYYLILAFSLNTIHSLIPSSPYSSIPSNMLLHFAQHFCSARHEGEL